LIGYQSNALPFPSDHTDSLIVIVVCVTDENNFRVAVFEIELLDVLLDERQVFTEVRINEDVSL